MKYFFKSLAYTILVFIVMSCQKSKIVENQFSSLNDTILVKTKKIKGSGLFELGFGSLKFSDTSKTFSSTIKYPKNIEDLKRLQLKTDFKEAKDYDVEILLGYKDGKQFFIIDENNNKDLTDDPIRELEKIDWKSPPGLVKVNYLISDGKQIVKDSSWLCVGNSNGRILLGRREHLVGKFSVENEFYEIGVSESKNPMSFTYGFQPEIALLSYAEVKKDSLDYTDLLKFGEALNLNNSYYRFEKISNNGDIITLIRDRDFETKIGTQKGMLAPDFEVVSMSGDTISRSSLKREVTIIANSCGCGGDKESIKAFYEMEKLYGDRFNILHVDSNIKEPDIGTHVDSEEKFNKNFYNSYRKEYCSRICYVIGKNKRIIDKFKINQWKTKMKLIDK